jgi:hypothetical protein
MTTEEKTVAVDGLLLRTSKRAGTADETSRPKDSRWLGALAIGFLLQVGWRLWLSWPLIGPVAHPDEDGYLLAARVVGGGAPATLPGWSIMRPIGYPLFLAPIHWFVTDPIQVYRGVHVVNATLMGLIFPLIYVLARRLFDLARWPALGIAFVLATLPSAVFFSQFALTDALLPALVLTQLVAVYGMVARSGAVAAAYGALAGAVAGYAANTHVRGLVMLVVLGIVVLIGLLRRWLRWPTAVATGVAAAVVGLAGTAGNAWLQHRMFPDGPFAVNERIFDRLTSFDGALGVIIDAGGQIWHLCSSTWGLGAFGLVGAALALVRREWPRPTRIVLGTALGITIGIALATATGIPYETEKRINNHIYGRYVAIFAAFWVLVAVVSLLRSDRRRAKQLLLGSAALVAATLGAVVVYWHDEMRNGSYVNFDSPELSFLALNFRSLPYYWVNVTVLGLLVFWTILLTRWRTGAQRRTHWWEGRNGTLFPIWLTMVGLALVNVVAMVAITDKISRNWEIRDYYASIPLLQRDAGVHPGDSIVQATSVSWYLVLRHQEEVYWERLPTFDPTVGAPPGRPKWVIASTGTHKQTDWPGTKYGYTEILQFRDSTSGICVVWRRVDG